MTPVTAPQLQIIRDTAGQYTELYLAKFEPIIVFQAQINDASIVKGSKLITFDNVVTGSYTNLVNGQSAYIGSTQGGNDIGRVRVRSATATQITVAVDDAINYKDNQYITVRDFYEIWPVFPFVSLNTGTLVPTFYKDWDITYSDQNENFDPVIIMGPDFAGIYESSFALTGVYFTATGSYTVDGSTISSYSWNFPPGCSITGSTSGTPGYVVFPAAGMYTVRLAVTASNGKTSISHRHIMLLNQHYGDATVAPALNYEDIADWEFEEITTDNINGAIGKVIVRNRANEFRNGDLVVIFAKDWYQYAQQSFGGYPGREHIVFIGYVDKTDSTYDSFISKSEFILKGTAAYLQNKQMFSVQVTDTQGTPADWTFIKNLTINKGLNHYMRWHSTLLNVKDFNKLTTGEGDYHEDIIQFQKGEILSNLQNFTTQKLLGFVSSNRQGAMFTEIDLQILLTGSRPASEFILREGDWIGETKISEIVEQPVSDVLMGGVAYDPTVVGYLTGVPLLSRAPGQWQTYIGKSQNNSGITLPANGQSTLNNISGLYYAKENNVTPELQLELSYNMRNIDMYPQAFYDYNISGTVNLYRGFNWKPKRIIPRKETIKLDKFVLRQTITFEPETYGPPGDTVVIPVTVPGGDCTDCGTPPPCDCAKNPTCEGCGGGGPGIGDGNTVYAFANGIVARTRNFLSASPTWTNITNTTAGSGNGTALILDPYNPVNIAYRSYQNVVEKTSNLNDTLPTWSSVLTSTTVETAMSLSSVVLSKMSATIVANGTVYVAWTSSTRCGISYTLDGGSTWTHHLVGTGKAGPYRIIASNWVAGTVWFVGDNNTTNAQLNISTNYGASWTALVGEAFTIVWDFDVSYPDQEKNIVVRQSTGKMFYSHDFGGTYTTAGTTTITPNALQGGFICMNIATQDGNDVLWGEQTGDFWHSTDGGITWSIIYNAGSSFCAGQSLTAVGRWPYDKNKVYFMTCNGGIFYSTDLLGTVSNKIGDWGSGSIGSAFDNPIMVIPLWLGY